MPEADKFDDVTQQQLHDLVFEIIQGRDAKFLLAVCDDIRQARNIRSELKLHIQRRGKHIVYIPVRSLRADFLECLFGINRTGDVDAIGIWGVLTSADVVVDSAGFL